MKLKEAMQIQNDMGQRPNRVTEALRDHWEEYGPRLLNMLEELWPIAEDYHHDHPAVLKASEMIKVAKEVEGLE